ncbi:MAG: hypothetical protein JSS72_04870 [Armatimonadetes bacterium]|nr:hypothetical protein [Armatimonadota bacterium]
MAPNWSFGRNRFLAHRFGEILESSGVTVYYCQGDVDHNRTVTAYSGLPDQLEAVTMELAKEAFAAIDLNHHVGVHPRVGALDVCPVVRMPGDKSPESEAAAQALVSRLGERIAEEFAVPVFLYEHSETGKHPFDLPSLRKGGFGGLVGKILTPDFGPSTANPLLGVSIIGFRDFLIAMNVNLRSPNPGVAKTLASRIRDLRKDEPGFEGVRALGFLLQSRKQSQVSLNLTMPDRTPIDPILEWVRKHAEIAGVAVAANELIGVIREQDLEHATRLPYKPQQVVERID